jgi:hypothetical protein
VSKVLTLLRRHAVAFAALFLLLGSAAYAAANNATTSTTPKRIYACVAGGHRTLNLTTAERTCPNGQSKISWIAAGRHATRGPAGATGKTGAQGATGDSGPAVAASPAGSKGDNGDMGPQGAVGSAGSKGDNGDTGSQGAAGLAGSKGDNGDTGSQGTVGPAGPKGDTGDTGSQGPAGSAGTSTFAEFFALMPPDNAATVAPGTDVGFPQDGPTSGDVLRIDPSSFNLPSIGTYRVAFNVSVDEPGQLILTLNGADLAYTVTGRATGTSQITAGPLVQTTVINSVLTVRNPAGNSNALTITPLAGGTRPVAATLTIERL